jgi:hypothetical protein
MMDNSYKGLDMEKENILTDKERILIDTKVNIIFISLFKIIFIYNRIVGEE